MQPGSLPVGPATVQCSLKQCEGGFVLFCKTLLCPLENEEIGLAEIHDAQILYYTDRVGRKREKTREERIDIKKKQYPVHVLQGRHSPFFVNYHLP